MPQRVGFDDKTGTIGAAPIAKWDLEIMDVRPYD